MADGLRSVAALPDPVGEVVEGSVRPNGLRVRRVRVPLGVVGIIYENRPNVTSDAAGLCLKSGNAALLRGSAGAIESNRAIAAALREGIGKAGLPDDAVLLVEDTSHETVEAFVRLRGVIDCSIPRGGPALVSHVLERATVPFVIDGDGNCHVYVDETADLEMAERIVVNAKMQRPSVCNADGDAARPPRGRRRSSCRGSRAALEGVELVGDERARRAPAGASARRPTPTSRPSSSRSKIAIGVVDDLDAAIAHIARYCSGHSEAIITRDLAAATRFVQRGRRGCGARQRLDALRRRRRARPRRRDRHLDPEAARPRADGPARADLRQVRHRGRRPGPRRERTMQDEPRFASVDEVRAGLATVGYLADDEIATRGLPRRPPRQADARRGPGGHRQDRAREVDRARSLGAA